MVYSKSNSSRDILKQSSNGNYKLVLKNGISILIKTLSSSSIFDNSLGHYFADDKGSPMSGCIDIVSVKDIKEQGQEIIIKYECKDIPKGAKQLGFFLIPNGASLNKVTVGDIINFKSIAGIWSLFVNNYEIQGASIPAFFSDEKMNFDSIPHMRYSSGSMIGWNDRFAERDDKFDDVLLNTVVYKGTDLNISKSDVETKDLAKSTALQKKTTSAINKKEYANATTQESNLTDLKPQSQSLKQDSSSRPSNDEDDWNKAISEL